MIAAVLVTTAWATPAALAQRAPDMATLDRGDGIRKLALDFGFIDFDAPPYSGAFRFELHGQYVWSSGLGLYGAVPLSLSFGDDDDPPGDQDDLAIGGVELGMLYVRGSPSLSWVFRGGLVLPTADDTRDGSLTNGVSIWPRLTDAVRATPDAVYARPALSLLYHDNKLFARVDLGLDLGLDSDAADEVLRLNLGVGYDFGVVALSLELVNLAELDDIDDDEDALHTLTFCARFMTERLEPFVAVGTPLDDSARGLVDFFLAAGLQFPL